MMTPSATIANYLKTSVIDKKDKERLIQRLKKGLLSKSEEPLSHFGSLVIPYDPITNKVLLVHHKKANSWIFPGGHMELKELPRETAKREVFEELGIEINENVLEGPISLQVFDIKNPLQKCKEHFDVFYSLPISMDSIKVINEEFFAYEWVSFEKVLDKIELEYYKRIFKKFINYKSNYRVGTTEVDGVGVGVDVGNGVYVG